MQHLPQKVLVLRFSYLLITALPYMHLLLLRQQIPQRKIIHNILHILDSVLETIAAAAQAVILQIQNLEAGEQVLHELVDQYGTLVVTKRNSIACQSSLCKC